MQRTQNNQNYFEEKEQKERTSLPDFQISRFIIKFQKSKWCGSDLKTEK